jgi:hypothetical protein
LPAENPLLGYQRSTETAGTLTAGAINYNLKRWGVPMRYFDDGEVLTDSDWIKNRLRSWPS